MRGLVLANYINVPSNGVIILVAIVTAIYNYNYIHRLLLNRFYNSKKEVNRSKVWKRSHDLLSRDYSFISHDI